MSDHSVTSEPNLDPGLESKFRDLCAEGYEAYDRGDTKTALRHFYEAWTLLPKPQSEWKESAWVLAAIGDAYYAQRNFDSGIEALRSATHCRGGQSNPFIHLRLGQCFFEKGDLEQAHNAFLRTRDHGGEQLFAKEDPKYQAFLQQRTEENVAPGND